LERNDVIFHEKVTNIVEVLDRIKQLSWSWFTCIEGKKLKTSFYIGDIVHFLVSKVYDIDNL